MAGSVALLENFLCCPVCLENFTDPVSLSCNHSFCSSCLQQSWEKAENKKCPKCRKESSQDSLLVNFALKELASSFAEIHEAAPSETGAADRTLVCGKHPEEPKLFCKVEERAVCPVCDLSANKSHRVIPIQQAVRDMKEQLRSDLESLQDKRNKYRNMKRPYDEMAQECKKQRLLAEEQIKAEFNKFHQFLIEEEESRLAALRVEEEQKVATLGREMEMIQDLVSSLSDSICAVEEDLHKDNGSFLSSYKSTQTRARGQCTESDPQLVSGALIDVAQHLGNLSFRVWEKMKDMVHFSPVILDPNSASPWLHLSHDLSRVGCESAERQKLPDNPERDTKYPTVLGSEGFSSGKHSWEVEVGDNAVWNIGLIRQSIDRKEVLLASPEYGIWCLQHRSGKYTNGAGLSVTVKKRLQRLRVQLDHDTGEVSFFNAEDSTHIYTHKDAFTETLFPFFTLSKTGEVETTDLKICPADVSLSY